MSIIDKYYSTSTPLANSRQPQWAWACRGPLTQGRAAAARPPRTPRGRPTESGRTAARARWRSAAQPRPRAPRTAGTTRQRWGRHLAAPAGGERGGVYLVQEDVHAADGVVAGLAGHRGIGCAAHDRRRGAGDEVLAASRDRRHDRSVLPATRPAAHPVRCHPLHRGHHVEDSEGEAVEVAVERCATRQRAG